MDGETFGKLLRAARKQAGFHTIAAFADAVGHWENDRRRPYSSDADRPKTLETVWKFMLYRLCKGVTCYAPTRKIPNIQTGSKGRSLPTGKHRNDFAD